MHPILVADFKTGFENVKDSYLLSNDSFPVLKNAFVRRGKVRRKPGSSLLGRFQRVLSNQKLGKTDGAGIYSVNVFTFLSLETDASFVPSSISITVGAQTFTEPSPPDGTLSNGAGGTGTINYSTGNISIITNPALLNTDVFITFTYYPVLPVMGLESYEQINTFPVLVALDTKYSYQFDEGTNVFYDTTFYAKSAHPFTWSGADYQQFYSTTWKDSLWVTNGKPGLHFDTITAFPDFVGATPNITLTNSDLSNGDWVFFNEVSGATVTDINGFSAQVIDDSLAPNYQFQFSQPITMTTWGTTGIVQYLTQSKSSSLDGIRYYIGDPITSIAYGWINFAPPLSEYVQGTNDHPLYLVGADIVLPFKDRILFFGCYYQASNSVSTYYSGRLTYSQNGTPYYHSVVPSSQSALVQVQAWYQNVPARGGFIDPPVEQQIVNVNNQEDVLICAFESSTRRLIFTGDDSFPFIYQGISSDFGGGHTFSSVSLEDSVVFAGNYGFCRATQTSMSRIDVSMPDEIFQIAYQNNGLNRVCSIRDFRNEFIYFSVPLKDKIGKFPCRTYVWNYRENNWAYFDESVTHYGRYQRSTYYTWATLPYNTWAEWLVPWNYGGPDERFPSVIIGNQQGFVLIKDDSTVEGYSKQIKSISGNVITCPNHGLENGDIIQIIGMVGAIADELPNNIFQKVSNVTENDFQIEITPTNPYIGGATFRIIPNFVIRTKQFAPFWAQGRRTRFNPSRFLFDNAPDGQVTINFYTSQVDSDSMNSMSSYPVYSTTVLTGAMSSQSLKKIQNQIWHRLNIPCVGDSISIEFTLNETQLKNDKINKAIFNICALYLETVPSGFI